MSLFSYNQNPEYPDRYTRNKKWVKVLPVKGRAIQTAEITEIQSIIQDNLKQGFNTLFKSGTALSGLKIGIYQIGDREVNVSISRGQLYVEGLVIDVEENVLAVPSEGIHNIGVLVEERIITELEDGTLRDPLRGGDLYGPAGASRLVWDSSIVLNNNNAYTIGQVVNGSVSQKNLNPFYQIEKTLSLYTYERSGNFCVCGYDVTSLGISKRTVADSSKYFNLQSSLDNLQNEQQTLVSRVSDLSQTLEELKLQYSAAIRNVNLSPSSTNSQIAFNLRTQIENSQAQLDLATSELSQKGKEISSSRLALESSSNLLVDKEAFNISPGVAYVEGQRVNITSPSSIIINRDIPTTEVHSVKFNYAGQPAVALRTFSYNPTTNTAIVNEPNTKTVLKIKLSNLPNTTSIQSLNSFETYSIEITKVIVGSSSTISSLLKEIENEINSDVTNASLNFSYKLFNSLNVEVIEREVGNINTIISAGEKRSLLKRHVTTESVGDKQLLFTSRGLRETDNNIRLEIDISKVDSSNSPISSTSSISVDIQSGFLQGGSTTTAFQLGYRPVAEVNNLVAELEEPLKQIVRGNIVGGEDSLGEDSIFEITRVYDDQREYIQNVHYRLVGQNRISWNLSLSTPDLEPEVGKTYYVSYLYTQSLAKGLDYDLDRSTDSIIFKQRTPAIGRNFTVDYSYYLSRIGIITLDKDGKFGYILSAASQEPTIPSISTSVLGICSFRLYAQSTTITKFPCQRQTVADLNILSNKVKENTKTIEIIKLDLEAIKTAQINQDDPIGMLNDPIQDLSKIDLEKSTASVVPSLQGLTAGYLQKDIPLKRISGGLALNNETSSTQYFTIPYTQQVLLSQSRATGVKDINSKDVSIKERGKIYLSQQYIFLNNPFNNLSPCDALSNILNTLTINQSSSLTIQTIVSSIRNLLGQKGYEVANSLLDGTALASEELDTVERSFVKRILKEVRSNTINISLKAEDLPANTEGFKLLLSGKEIPFTLQNGTSYSINPIGTIKTKVDGTIYLTFQIPTNTSCGVHTIELLSQNKGYAKSRISIYNNLLTHICISALKSWGGLPVSTSTDTFLPIEFSDYIAEDLLKLGIDNTIFPEVISNLVSSELSNSHKFPIKHLSLNQTFESPDYFYLTQIKVKLKSGSTDNNSYIKIHLRDADDEPFKNTYGVAVANTYNFSSTANIFTTFTFPYPILLQRNKKYSIGIKTRGEYKVYTAVLGERDLLTNSILGNQLYLEGDLFESKDGVTLNQYDREDLTYELNRAEFQNQVTIDLGYYGTNDSFSNITYFALNNRDIVPSNTEILYEYAQCTDSNICNSWVSFKPNVINCLPNSSDKIRLRATLKTLTSTLAPFLHFAGASISLYSASASSYIVSCAVNFPESYRKIKVILQYIKPSGTDIEVDYSPTQGFSWEGTEWKNLPIINSSTRIIDNSISLYESTYYLEESSLFYILALERKRFRYRIKLSSINPAIQPLVKNIKSYVY